MSVGVGDHPRPTVHCYEKRRSSCSAAQLNQKFPRQPHTKSTRIRGAEIAIIDITGMHTVDTLTAQHLLKTVSAARLVGANCIIGGIRPQIAQTIVWRRA